MEEVIDTEKKLLSITGFYPKRHNDYPSYYNFSAFINILVTCLQLSSMVGQMIVDKKDIAKITDTLLFFMTQFTFLGKLTNFLYYRRQLLVVEDKLSEAIFHNLPHDKFKILASKLDGCKAVAKNFRVLCVLCIIFYSILPCFLDGQKLPMPGWVPYDEKKYYLQTAIFQILSVCVCAYNNSSFDILTWKLITISSGHLQILNENLSDLVYGGAHETKMAFTNCIKHHSAIIEIEFIFSKGIFLQFLSSVMIICATGFQLLVVPIFSTQFVFLALYIVCMMLQVAMYCWYGHEIMTTSDKIGRYCYMSNWYDSEPRMRKCLGIFLEATKKPLALTAGNFVKLSLPTLTTILRSSYSYFAVLQRLYDES